MGKLTYRPEIDGLRAVSVLMVLAFHAGFGFPGGFVGVDVFFVISGYLITSLVMKDIENDRFSFIDFWERRVRRIFPALAVMVMTTLLAGSFLLLPEDFSELAISAIYQALLVANYYFYDSTGYFQGAADLKPLLHTWSLAVEEQFYLILPLILLSWRNWPASRLRQGIWCITLVSFILSVWCTSNYPKIAFYFLPTRAWELMIGTLLAIFPAARLTSKWSNELLSGSGLVAILSCGLWYTGETPFPGASALIPCLGAACLIFANGSSLTWVGQLLAHPVPVFIGKISYSLYLWHWPILALLRHVYGEVLPLEVRLIAVGSSFVLGWASWRFIETPFRRTTAMDRKRVFGLSTGISAALVVFCTTVIVSDGWRFRFPDKVLAVIDGSRIAELKEQELIPVGPPLSAGESPRFLLWGDSHARAVSSLIRTLAEKHQIQGVIASRSATIPALDTWRRSDRDSVQWNRKVVDFIKEQGIQHVIMASRWTINIDGRPDGSLNSLIIDAEASERSREESGNVMRRSMKKTLRELEQAGVTVWILLQVPQQKADIPKIIAQSTLFPGFREIPRTSLQEHRQYQARVNAILQEFCGPNVRLLDPTPFCFDEKGYSISFDDQLPFYCDDHHLSEYGANRLLSALMEPFLQEIADTTGLAGKPKADPSLQQASHSEAPPQRN